MQLLVGTSGVAPPLSTAVAGQPAMYTVGSCAAGLGAFYPGSRLLYALFLGPATLPGGVLTITTCGHTANNTVLYVGVGCPVWAQPFGCRAGNDNAVAPVCAGNALASTIAVVVTQATYYVQLGGVHGEDVVSGLGWRYSAPTSPPTGTSTARPSPKRTRTRGTSRSRSAMATPSKSGSRTVTRSRSRKRKPVA